MHRRHHLLVSLGTGDGQDRRVGGTDLIGIAAHAAGDDHPAVLGDRLADRLERLALGRIEKAAGVDDDRISPLVIGGKAVSFGRQPAQDALAVDERLGAAEADDSDGWDAGSHGGVRWTLCSPWSRAPKAKSKAQGLAPSLGSYGLYPPPWEEGGCGTPTSVVARRTLLFLPRLGPLATVVSVIEPRLSMPFDWRRL